MSSADYFEDSPSEKALVTGVRMGGFAAVIKDEVWAALDSHAADLVGTATVTRAALDAAYRPTVNVMDPRYGVAGDGTTDDTAAIQAAIDAAISTGIKRLYFPDRTYIISGSGDMLTATEGLELFGPGRIKVKDANGPWKSMFSTGLNDASGMHIHGLTWDGNATNNQPVAGDVVDGHYPAATRRVMIRVDNGVGVLVENCTFYDHDGEWAFISASDGVAQDIQVLNNQFLKMGNLTDPALVHDHSTIYIDAIGFEVAGNTFSAYEAGVTTGPISYGAISNIDTHGSGQKVHHNVTIGYLYAGQLSTSPYRPNVGVEWHHNIAIGCGHGMHVVPYNSALSGVAIHDNYSTLDFLRWKDHPWGSGPGSCGLELYSTNTGACTDVTIVDNTFRWLNLVHTGKSDAPTVLSSGVRWQREESGHTVFDRNITISRNRVIGAPDNGVYLRFSNVDGLEVCDNVIEDAVSTANAHFTHSVAFYVDAYTSKTNYRIDGNMVRDTQSPSRSSYGNTVATPTAAYSLWAAAGSEVVARDNRALATTGWLKMLREADKASLDPAPLRLNGDYLPEHSGRTTAAMTADDAYWVPIRLGTGAFSQAAIEIITAAAGSTVEAALYADANGRPGKKLYSLGTIDSSLTSWRATAAGTWPVQAGIYWLAFAVHGGTPTLRMATGRNQLIAGPAFTGVTSTDLTGIKVASVASLPAAFSTAGNTFGQGPVFYVVGL